MPRIPVTMRNFPASYLTGIFLGAMIRTEFEKERSKAI